MARIISQLSQYSAIELGIAIVAIVAIIYLLAAFAPKLLKYSIVGVIAYLVYTFFF